MQILIIAVGKLKEKYLQEGIAEYKKGGKGAKPKGLSPHAATNQKNQLTGMMPSGRSGADKIFTEL